MLKSKKHNTQADWVKAYMNARQNLDIDRANNLITKALKRIPDGKCIYGWSGGKDALVLQIICEKAGITDCVLGSIGEKWEYPEFWQYVKSYAPKGLVIKDFGITAEYVNNNENLAFPQNSKDSLIWYQKCNQRGYYEYAKEKNADYILVGHRSQDGNNVVSTKNGKIYPIHDFTHEDIFCILACYGKVLPPIYFYKDGFYQGTHAWIMRTGKTALDDIYNIDKNILINNTDVNKVREYLLERGENI